MKKCIGCFKDKCEACKLPPALRASKHKAQILNTLRKDAWNGVSISEWPKLVVARHLEVGVVKYDNDDGTAKIYLLPKEAIDKMRPTAEGKPIVGQSGDFDHKNVKPSDFKDGEVDGVCVESFWDGENAWESLRFMCWDQETLSKCVPDGFQISCAYVPIETDGKPGKWHNVDFDETILSGEYTHFAVVPNPRYEGAVIQLVNSLKRGGIVDKMLKTLLNCIPLKQLKELVNSIEEDEKKKADDAKKNADEKVKKDAEDLAKKNATSPEVDKAVSELGKKETITPEAGAAASGAPIATNAAPPDPAVEGASVVTKEKQPDTGTQEAADAPKKNADAPCAHGKKVEEPCKECEVVGRNAAPAPESEPKVEPTANDGDEPQTRPEPGTPGAVQGPASADPKINDDEKLKERLNALRARRLVLSNADPKLEAQRIAARRRFEREERFNSLRKTAEERGGFVGTAGNDVVSVDDKQELGNNLYGSR